MIGCVLSQLKPSQLYILSCEKGLGSASTFFTAKNVALRELYPIRNPHLELDKEKGLIL